MGSLPSFKLLLNIRVNGLDSCGANSLRNIGCNQDPEICLFLVFAKSF